jgi:flagellar biosynthesis protein FlgN
MHTPGTDPAHMLGDEQAAANTMLQLLKQEQSALVDADVDRLATLTGEKAKIAALMAQCAQHRHNALEKAGFEASESGMQGWLDKTGANPAGKKAWAELLALVEAAKELNRVNGLLIGQHIARNQTALNILQGNAEGSAIYGPNGQSATKIGSRRLVVG